MQEVCEKGPLIIATSVPDQVDDAIQVDEVEWTVALPHTLVDEASVAPCSCYFPCVLIRSIWPRLSRFRMACRCQ